MQNDNEQTSTSLHDYDPHQDGNDATKRTMSGRIFETNPSSFQLVGEPGPLFAALAAARAAFRAITKNRKVKVVTRDRGSYEFEYATLDEVQDATCGPLAENGLVIIQPFSDLPNGGKELRTMLCHSSGAYLESRTKLPGYDKIQEMGSALTYMRRYQWASMLGVSAEEDDDGNAADGNQAQGSPRDRSKPPEPPKRSGQAPRGTNAQSSSKPAEAPKPAQDAPTPPKASEPPPAPAKPPAPATEERRGLLPEQLAKLGDLLKAPDRKWSGAQVKDLLLGLFNKGHAELTATEGDLTIQVLEQAARAGYQADQLLAMMPEFSTAEQPNAQAVINALDSEASAFP